MPGDSFRRVKPGEPLRISAPAWNAAMDAAEAFAAGRVSIQPGSAGSRWPSNVALAKNVSGEAVPWHAPVSVTGALAAGGEVLTVNKPGDGPYGIAVDPIPVDGCGLVALVGGPWQMCVMGSVAPGDRLAPVDGQWHAQLHNAGDLEALSADSDGVAWVRFGLGGSATGLTITYGIGMTYLEYSTRHVIADFRVPSNKTLCIVAAAIADSKGGNEAAHYLRVGEHNADHSFSTWTTWSSPTLWLGAWWPPAYGSGKHAAIWIDVGAASDDPLAYFVTASVAVLFGDVT